MTGSGIATDCVAAPPEAGPMSCSDAATVPLDPSERVAIDWAAPSTKAPFARTVAPALKVTALPTVALLLTLSGVQLWQLSGQAWMLVSVGLGAAVSTLALCTGVVALPYVLRTGATLRSGWLVSFYIATRNPVPVLAVLSALALSVWAAAYLSFALIVLLPAPLALVWAAAVTGATERSSTGLAARTGRPL